MQLPTNHQSSSTQTPVSVVVPMFNERECVASLMASLAGVEVQLGDRYAFEFVLVDDGSRDETVALLNNAISGRPNYRLAEHSVNRGIGAAIGTGIAAASHEAVVSMDCDGSYDPLLMGELLPLLADGVDLVTASPYHRAGGVENVPLWRLRLSRLASQLYGLACRHKLSCYTSCFRVYRRSAVIDIQLENPGFVGVAELLCQVLQQGGVVVEHPAMLRSRVAGHSKMRVVRASLGHLRLIGRVIADRFRSTESLPASAARSADHAHCQLRSTETSESHTTEETTAVQLA
jgi:glycosyltransferase involved in cell wall biosynthesis